MNGAEGLVVSYDWLLAGDRTVNGDGFVCVFLSEEIYSDVKA